MNLINFDKLGLMPNQLVDGDPTECAALTTTDIVGNILGILFDPDFTYASTLRLMGLPPNTSGLDPFATMQSAIYYGCLPVSQETFTALSNGELYIANWQNYSPMERQVALRYTMNGVMTLGADFSAILNYLANNQWCVSLPVKWYQNFMAAPQGLLTDPQGAYSNHNIEVVGVDYRGYLIVKSWLGKGWGDNGYGYLSKEIFDLIAVNSFAFDPAGIRWLQILGLLLTRFPALVLTPQLINANE